jgi:hypothetical protein
VGDVLGWVFGLSVVGTLVLLAASGADASENGEPATWVDVLELWMAGHNAAIMAVLCLVIGAKLIGDAITGLS